SLGLAPAHAAAQAHPATGSLLVERFERIHEFRRFRPMPRHRFVLALAAAAVLSSLAFPQRSGAETQAAESSGPFAGLGSLSSADLKLEAGSWVGVRLSLAIDAQNRVRAATGQSAEVYRRMGEDWVPGAKLQDMVALCFVGAAQQAVLQYGVL